MRIIINSYNIVFGFGSFIPALLLLNNNKPNIYYPKYADRYIIDLTKINNKYMYDLSNYIEVGEWKNTKEQRDILVNYNIKPVNII